nr:hypothetical protein [Thiomonas sp.]
MATEIPFDGQVMPIQGRNAALLAAAAGKKVGTARVPTFFIGWGTARDQDANWTIALAP